MEKIRQLMPEKAMMEESSDAAAVPDRRRCFGKRRAAYERAECAVSGFQLTPVRVGGSLRGEALHLLLPPPKPRLNDVLCRVRLTEKGWLLLPQVMEEIAAPGLCGTFSTRTPILIDRIEPEMLVCPAFCDALMQVQAREQLAIFVVADGAEKPLQQMMPENRQRWFSAPDTPAETLVEAAMLRL